MFIEYQLAPGLPWQADDHHFSKWEDRCKDKHSADPDKWCKYCTNSSQQQQQTRCENGYLNFSPVRATSRNYELFARLANVRGSGYRQALGLPDNVSTEVNDASEAYGADGHSHSHMSLEEFKNVIYHEMGIKPTKRFDAFYSYDAIKYKNYENWPPSYATLITYCDLLKKEKSLDKIIFGEDVTSEVQVRLVFWFDN